MEDKDRTREELIDELTGLRKQLRELKRSEDEHKKDGERLHSKIAFLEAQVNSTLDGILVVDSQNQRILLNQQLIDIWNVPEHILDQKGDEELLRYVTDMVKEPGAFYEKVMHLYGHPDETSRDEIEFKNGMILDRYSAPVLGDQGEYFGRIWTFRDITQRKRTEEALKESQQRMSDIINFLPDATFAIDREGRVIAWNRAIEEMTGVKAEDMLGKGDYEHALPFYGVRRPILIDLVFRSVKEIKKKYHSIQKEGDVLIAEADVPVRGEARALWGKASPLYDSKGDIAGAIESIRDITERKNLEVQFLQSQKMEAVGTLAGGIAHDLNNLLTGIRMHAYLGKSALEHSSPAYAKLKNIEDIVESAANLTRQFLGFARGGKYEVQPTDLNDVIEKTAAFFSRTRKEITIERKFEKALRAVDADQGQMEQVLLNLLVNAQHAMPGGGSITIGTENVYLDEAVTGPHSARPGSYVKISVTDNGSGIDEKIRSRIFDPFFTTKERGIGTGLGLASVYGIVKNHEGFLTVGSEVGKGSTFSIFLPATDRKPVKVKRGRTKLLTGTETILIVDDEKEILNVTSAIFEALGYRVYGADSGIKAVETYRAHRDAIAAVILDLVMPGMDGEVTFRRLREIDPDVKVMLASGYSMNESIERVMGEGCAAFVQKPYDIRALSARIREILDG